MTSQPRGANPRGGGASNDRFFSFIERDQAPSPSGPTLPAVKSASTKSADLDLPKACTDNQSEPCCGGCLDRMLRFLPRRLWFIMSFVVLIGIFMTFTVPSFLYYRVKGDTALSGQWHGWIGCLQPPTAASANINSTPAVILSRYKGVRSSLVNSDFEETTWNVTRERDFSQRFTQICPAVNPGSGTPLNDNEPYVKVEFTLSAIQADQASATMDINITAINCLSCTTNGTKPSLLNLTGGVVTILVAPALSQALTLDWNAGTKTYGSVPVQLVTDSPITDYPWDQYTIQRTISAEILLLNDTAAPEIRPIPLQVWTQVTTQQFNARVVDEQEQTAKSAGILYLNPVSPITIRITRSAFTKSYAVVLVVFLWLIGGLNLMHCLDNDLGRVDDLHLRADLLHCLFRPVSPPSTTLQAGGEEEEELMAHGTAMSS